MVGVFHVLVSFIAFSMPSSGAVPVPRSSGEFLRAAARDESLVAHSLLQTSATIRRWGAERGAEAAQAAESLVQVAKTEEVAAAESLSHVGKSLEQMASWQAADAPPARSLRKVGSTPASSSSNKGAATDEEEVQAAPSLLQMSEAEGVVEGSRADVDFGTHHSIVHGMPVRLSDWQGDSAQSWPSLNVVALLGVIAAFAVVMLQLTSQPSVTGQLGGRKSLGMQLGGPMQENGACATDRGS